MGAGMTWPTENLGHNQKKITSAFPMLEAESKFPLGSIED